MAAAALLLAAGGPSGGDTGAGNGGGTTTVTSTPAPNNTALVLGTDHKLWLEHGPWGMVPPPWDPVDGSVLAFQAIYIAQEHLTGDRRYCRRNV